MKKKIYYIVVNIYFVLLILSIIVSSFLFTYKLMYNDFISHVLIVYGIIGFLLYLYYRFVFKKAKIYDLLIIIMAFLGYISYTHAYDKRVALIGFISGREGLLVILSYYVFFLLASTINSKKFKNIIIGIISLYGLLNAFYGMLQIYNVNNLFGIPIVYDWSLPSAIGILSNSNIFGTLSVIMLGIWLSKYTLEKFNKKKLLYFILLFIFLISIFISGAMSAFVALIAMLLILFIYLFFKNKDFSFKEKVFNIFSVFTLICLSYTLVVITTDVKLNEDVEELSMQITETANGNVNDSYGTGRIHIWKEVLHYLPDYLYTGIGVDNLAYIGNKDGKYIFDPYTSNVVYKAHNEYLQILATEGIFKFFVYMIFLGIIFIATLIRIVKDKNNNVLLFTLFLVFCGYLVQAFFNISITRIAPIFFIIMGFLIEDEKTSL